MKEDQAKPLLVLDTLLSQQNQKRRYTYNDFQRFIQLYKTLMDINDYIGSQYYYSGKKELYKFLVNEFNYEPYINCIYDILNKQDCNHIYNLSEANHANGNQSIKSSYIRSTASVSNHITNYLIQYGELSNVNLSTQRKDSAKKGHKNMSKYQIPANHIMSSLALFQFYDGRSFEARKDQQDTNRLPRYKQVDSGTISSYEKTISSLITTESKSLIPLFDANSVLHFIDLTIFNWYLGYFTSDDVLDHIVKSCNISYVQIKKLKETVLKIIKTYYSQKIFDSSNFLLSILPHLEKTKINLDFMTLMKNFTDAEALIKQCCDFNNIAADCEHKIDIVSEYGYSKEKIQRRDLIIILRKIESDIIENPYFKTVVNIMTLDVSSTFTYLKFDDVKKIILK